MNADAGLTEALVSLTAADGFKLQGFRVQPQGERRGGLVVLQEIFGLTEQMKSVVRSYAADGYDSVLPCLFDRVSPGLVAPFMIAL